MSNLSVEEFFQQKGMRFETTTLLSVVEDRMRMPDIVVLFQEFAQLKLQEYLQQEAEKRRNFEENNPFIEKYHEDDVCG